MAFGMKDVLNGAKSVAGSNLVQGVLNNYSEMTTEDMQKEYGMYLMDGEEITVGFKLVRDALIFTNKRIIFTDKQGATGVKMRVTSINLFSVVDVTMETAGFGFDDSELTFTYHLSFFMLRKNGYKNNTYTVLEICGTISLVVGVLYVLRYRIVFSCPGAGNTGDFLFNLNH